MPQLLFIIVSHTGRHLQTTKTVPIIIATVHPTRTVCPSNFFKPPLFAPVWVGAAVPLESKVAVWFKDAVAVALVDAALVELVTVDVEEASSAEVTAEMT